MWYSELGIWVGVTVRVTVATTA